MPIGRPIANTQVYLLDKNLAPAPIGVTGELYIAGDGLARCYLNSPELTAERFIPNPFSHVPGARLYKSGDAARYLPDGNIDFLGRLDDQVKIRGYRVELAEVEAALAEHTLLRDVTVISREDGPGETRLVAYIVTDQQAAPSIPELRSFLKQKLPDYMVPSAFIQLDALPLLASGKVDRRALPAPDRTRPEMEGFVAPRTPIEESVANIWADVLGLEQVGINDNFFVLGGHSLLITQVISRLRESFKTELPIRCMFDAPTVAGLAQVIDEASRSAQQSLPPITKAPRDVALPLSFAQERIWFLSQLDPESTSYHVPRAVRINGPLDIDLLKRTFTELVRRHEILRTSFPTVNGQPIQVIHPPGPFPLTVIDLRLVDESERQEQVRQIILEEGQRLFDLANGPMMRVSLLQLSDEENVLALTEHHLIHDGWTQGVFVSDFLAIYTAFSQDQASPLPELDIQYADFAYWQRQWLSGEFLEKELAYWKQQLSGTLPVLSLPTDHPRPAVQSFRGAEHTLLIPAKLADALRSVSRQQGVTLFMTMLAAFKVLLYRYTDQEDIVVGSGIASRRWREIEGLLGMVINTFVLRADLSGNPMFHELLTRVREICLGAYAHQDLPFEKLVEHLQPDRSLSYNPVFQVIFGFMDTPMPQLRLPGLNLTAMDAHNRSAKFDLNVTVMPLSEQHVGQVGVDETGEIEIFWEYNTDLFEGATISRMMSHYATLLDAVTTDFTLPTISDLPLLTPQEEQSFASWNQTSAPLPQLSVDQLISLQPEARPQANALSCGEATLCYQELNHRANQLAHYLRSRSIAAEQVVAVCLERSIEQVVALLGVMKAGGAYCPPPFLPC